MVGRGRRQGLQFGFQRLVIFPAQNVFLMAFLKQTSAPSFPQSIER